MSTPEQAPRRTRRSAFWPAAAVLLVLGVITLVWVLSHGQLTPAATSQPTGTDSPTTSQSTSTASTPAPSSATSPSPATTPTTTTPVPAAVETEATQNVTAFVTQNAAVLAAPPTEPSGATLTAMATGVALDSALSAQAEYTSNKWHQEGSPTVVSSKVVAYDPAATPPTLTLDLCIDSSKVNVLTDTGAVVKAGQPTDRSLNIMTVVKSASGSWLLSKTDFPTNADC